MGFLFLHHGVASLARPGSNVTGFSVQSKDLASNRVEILREVISDLRRLAILTNVGNSYSLAQPGGNVTGMSLMFPELAAKRLNLLTQAVPGISRVLVLSYLADPVAQLQVQALQNTARTLGVMLQVQDIRTGDDLPAAVERGVKECADGLITTSESIFGVLGARARSPLSSARDVPPFAERQRPAADSWLMAQIPTNSTGEPRPMWPGY